MGRRWRSGCWKGEDGIEGEVGCGGVSEGARYRIGLAGIGWDRLGDRSYGNCQNEEANVEMGIGLFLEFRVVLKQA